MPENQQRPGTFMLVILDPPTCPLDIEVFKWVMNDLVCGPELPEIIRDLNFEHPYGGGGGKIVLKKLPWSEVPGTGWWGEPDFEKFKEADYTGWYAEDNYEDSMTPSWKAPLFKIDGVIQPPEA